MSRLVPPGDVVAIASRYLRSQERTRTHGGRPARGKQCYKREPHDQHQVGDNELRVEEQPMRGERGTDTACGGKYGNRRTKHQCIAKRSKGLNAVCSTQAATYSWNFWISISNAVERFSDSTSSCSNFAVALVLPICGWVRYTCIVFLSAMIFCNMAKRMDQGVGQQTFEWGRRRVPASQSIERTYAMALPHAQQYELHQNCATLKSQLSKWRQQLVI